MNKAASLVALVLYMLFKMSIIIATWAQAEIVAYVSYSLNSDMADFVLLAAIFCVFVTFHRFRGHITIPVNRIIECTVTLACKSKIINSVSRFPLQSLDKDETHTNIKRAADKAENLQGAAMMFADDLSGIISLLIFFTALVSYDMGLIYIVIILATVLSSNVFSFLFTEREIDLRIRQTNSVRKAEYYYNLQTERISSLELKIDNLCDFFINKWETENNKQISEKISLDRWGVFKTIGASVSSEVLAILLLFIITYQFVHNHLIIADFMYIMMAAAACIGLFENLLYSIRTAYHQGMLFEPIQKMIELDDSVASQNELKSVEKLNIYDSDVLHIENVSFSYDSRKKVLSNISLKVRAGEVIALVGPNGGGKSTLSKIALGLLAPDDGEVHLYGVPVRTMDSVKRRKLMGVVFQDFFGFRTSLRDNVGFGDIDLINNDDAIHAAMQRGGSEKLLTRVSSLDTSLGRNFDEKGIELSGGEWQRLAVSRGLMGEHSIIVFDESTAAIDPIAEVEQFEKVRAYLQGKSGILVSHRIGLCKFVDRIVVLNEGVIQEEGTHDDLIKSDGFYAELYREQSKWYKLEQEEV